jgi:hypothetical protein
MAAEIITAEQTWRCLWSHAAYDIISALVSTTDCERIQVGAGWGFRSHTNGQRALLLHPSGNGREAGDLALTVLGQGTHVIPRCSYSYTKYLDEVADIVETASRAYLESAAADTLE